MILLQILMDPGQYLFRLTDFFFCKTRIEDLGHPGRNLRIILL